jgi:hypothetical protein
VTEPIDAGAQDLRGRDLRGRDLRHLDNLSHMGDLSGADLRGADLRDVWMTSTDCQGANFSGADLRGANLELAYFTGATLDGARIDGCHLQGDELTSEQLGAVRGHPAYKKIVWDAETRIWTLVDDWGEVDEHGHVRIDRGAIDGGAA